MEQNPIFYLRNALVGKMILWRGKGNGGATKNEKRVSKNDNCPYLCPLKILEQWQIHQTSAGA